jgi:hypothetical protein
MDGEVLKIGHRVIMMHERGYRKTIKVQFTVPIKCLKKNALYKSLQLTKLNTRQIDSVVETLSKEIVDTAHAVANHILADNSFTISRAIDDNFNKSISDNISRLVEDTAKEVIYNNEANKTFFRHFQELWFAQKQTLIEHITKTSFKPLHSSEVSKKHELNRLIQEYKKSITLGISRLKNSIKRSLLRLKQKSGKVVSVIKTLIEFIITPRLFGIYVSEEENNGLAVSFSNC